MLGGGNRSGRFGTALTRRPHNGSPRGTGSAPTTCNNAAAVQGPYVSHACRTVSDTWGWVVSAKTQSSTSSLVSVVTCQLTVVEVAVLRTWPAAGRGTKGGTLAPFGRFHTTFWLAPTRQRYISPSASQSIDLVAHTTIDTVPLQTCAMDPRERIGNLLPGGSMSPHHCNIHQSRYPWLRLQVLSLHSPQHSAQVQRLPHHDTAPSTIH
jgi:hypothetical protein